MKISYHSGCCENSYLAHNNRTHISSNVIEDRIKENITYANLDAREAYDIIFGKYIDQYNNNQKRNDRKIINYYDDIGKNKQQHNFYELIIQIGSYDDKDEHNDECAEVLNEYMKGFQKKNPRFVVFNAVLHKDEEGMPHLHICYIPVAKYNKGLKFRNSLSQACNQMGYETKNKIENGYKFWLKEQRSTLREMCIKRGIEIEEETKSGRQYLTPEEYRQAKDKIREEVSNDFTAIYSDLETRSIEVENKEQQYKEKSEDLDTKLELAKNDKNIISALKYCLNHIPEKTRKKVIEKFHLEHLFKNKVLDDEERGFDLELSR